MRLLFIRHGDPDYENDTLTEKGKREAQLLADIIEKLRPGEIYVSPLGRARKTASYSLERLGKEEQILDWLQEFPAKLDPNLSEEVQQAYSNELKLVNGRYKERIVWDMLPAYWTEHEEYFDPARWRETAVARCSDMIPVYDEVTSQFDKLLARCGYVREGRHYRVVKSSEDTVTFFCHFGITAILLSHLWNISPFLMLHNTVLAPTSVSEVVTEERQQGIAYFRSLRLGDITHLSIGGEPPSFSARFCERYENVEQRH